MYTCVYIYIYIHIQNVQILRGLRGPSLGPVDMHLCACACGLAATYYSY